MQVSNKLKFVDLNTGKFTRIESIELDLRYLRIFEMLFFFGSVLSACGVVSAVVDQLPPLCTAWKQEVVAKEEEISLQIQSEEYPSQYQDRHLCYLNIKPDIKPEQGAMISLTTTLRRQDGKQG